MKIINKYVLKEHIGPFVFALSALTSLLLLQYIARKFGDLVGRGLSWQVIGEFFLLSIPFIAWLRHLRQSLNGTGLAIASPLLKPYRAL